MRNQVLSAWLLALSMSVSRPAAAKATCELRVEPEAAGTAWEGAIARARMELQNAAGDCGSARLRVGAAGAVLTFTTLDGRQAVRGVGAPEELMPTLEALLIQLPDDAEPAVVAPESPNPSVPEQHAPEARRVPSESGRVLWSALLGARLAGPDAFLSPTLALGAALTLSKWEVGVLAAWSPDYRHLDTDDRPNAHLASIAAGVAAGRRVRVGKFTAVAGIDLSASILHEAWHLPTTNTGQHAEVERERGQALFGAYTGAVLPATAKIRVKTTLSGDVDATHLVDGDATPTSDPALPWWGLTLTVGVEGDAL